MPKKRNRDQDGLYKRKDSPYWWVSYIDAGGARTRRSTGTIDRKEAEAILAKWRLDAHRQVVWDEQPSRSFDELMLAYLKATVQTGPRCKQGGANRTPNTVQTDGANRTPKSHSLARLSSVDVRKYISKRKQEGAAAGTINREVGLLSSAMNYANREWGWNLHNTAAMCKQREPEGRVRWLTRAEAAALLKAADLDSRSRHLADFIRLALNTGCRKGELLGLEWRRVDLKAELIYLEAHHTKSGKRRSVPLNSGHVRQFYHAPGFGRAIARRAPGCSHMKTASA